MINFILECILISFCSGISSAVYIKVLAYEPVINWWFYFGQKFEKKWFYKPVWGCIVCNSGQFSLWSYITFKGSYGWDNLLTLLLGGVYTICMAIFVAMWTGRAITKINNNQ